MFIEVFSTELSAEAENAEALIVHESDSREACLFKILFPFNFRQKIKFHQSTARTDFQAI